MKYLILTFSFVFTMFFYSSAEKKLPQKIIRPATAPVGGEKKIYKKVGNVELPLYIYRPIDHSPKSEVPAIVFFFGGGWANGSPAQFEHQCKDLAEKGMVAITVEYRVASRHQAKVEDCLEDAKSAMRWVRGHAKELGIDPNRIASGGGSAGAHLAVCVELIKEFNADEDDQSISAKPNAMVLFNPPMVLAAHKDLPDEYNQELNRWEELNAKKSHGSKEKISPFYYVSQKQPPCLMMFGTADKLLKGAEFYQKSSEKVGNLCELVTYKDQGHGFFNYTKGEKYYRMTMKEVENFLTQLGWLSKN